MMPQRSWRVSRMQSLRNLKDNKTVRYVILALLALMAALSLYQGIGNALLYSQDFQWDAAKALTMRLDPYELSKSPQKVSEYPELEAFYRMFTDKGMKQKMEANQFPSLLWLLAPMTCFAPDTARIVWTVLNLIFTAGIVFLLRKTFFEDADSFTFAVITLVMIAGTPYRNQLGVGQHTLFSFFFFMLAVLADRKTKKNDIKGTVAVSLCLAVSFFKYTLTAPLALYFIYRKRYKEIAIGVAVHVVMTVASAFWLGKGFIYMIKAPLEVASVLSAEGGIDLGVYLGSPMAYIAALLIGVALFVISLMFPKDKDNVLFPVLILWSLVLTYHRTYDFFVLSAVAVLFTHPDADIDGKTEDILKYWYILVIVIMYFVLRIFGESDISKMCAAVVYYAFAVAVTATGIRLIKRKSDG